jgi:outer membrane protein assembly factor BamB
LWCIDPTRRGDVSPDLVVDREGKAVAPARILAADPKLGQQVKANPNSAAVWHYQGKGGGPKDGKPTESAKDFKAVMHRSLGMPVIHQGLLVIGDFSGLVHCLDAKTGKACWTYDMLSAVWGSALVADGKIYLGDQDGDVVVFEHAPTLKVLAKNAMGNAVYGTPTTAGNMLYISTRTHLFAISGK